MGKKIKKQKSSANSNKNTANKKTKRPSAISSAMPFILIALALVIETCLILKGDAGKSGALVHKLFFGLFGYASHILAIAMLLIAFFYRDLKENGTLRFKAIFASLTVVFASVFNTLIAQNGLKDATLSFPTFFNTGALGESGGVFGGFFGILLSKLLTPTVATVMSAIVLLAFLGFTVGISRIGIWKLFSRHAEKAPAAASKPPRTPAKPVEAQVTTPDVSPVNIDTLVTGDNTPRIALPEFASTPDSSLQLFDDEEFTDEDFDELNITDGDTITTVDFNAPENATKAYTPTDLMEEFGFNKQQEPKKDVYDEAPKPKPQKQKKITLSGKNGRAYSPFATIMSREEFFENAPKSSASNTPKAPGKAYSPFSDPVRSMNEPDRHSTNLPPQSYIASGAKDRWADEHPQIPSVAEQYIPAEEAEEIVYVPSPQPESAPVYQSAPYESAVSPNATLIDIEEPKATGPFEYKPQPSASPFSYSAPSAPAFAPKQTQNVINEQITPTPIAPLVNVSAFDDEIEAPEQEDASSQKRAEVYETADSKKINPFGIYNKLRYPRYAKPSTDLLDPVDTSSGITEQEIYETQSKLLSTLESFRIDATLTGYSIGPSITRYEITPGPGVKVKQITGLSEDIGRALQSEKLKGEVRIVTVPGKPVIGVEVPNSVVTKVPLRSLIENKDFQKAKSKITVCVGLTVSGKPIYMNIDDMPHVLVAGQTKSGKSVAINCMIISLIYRASPDDVQLILIDPKRVELSIYNDIPHMIMPVIDDPKRAAAALKWAVNEMERRYQLLNDARVRNRDEYYATRDQNPKFEYMPQIVIIIDELADLMLQVREHVEGLINRLAAMARACGMHIVIGTQRPSVDVVTGLIKANIPSHISFKVSSQTDSRVILGNVGAEKLLGRGDMLYHPTGGNQVRAQGAFVDTPEIKRILNFIIEKNGKAEYDPEVMFALQNETDKLNKVDKKASSDDDYAIDSSDIDFDYLCQATELVLNMGKATTNIIQRHLKIGFNRAANLVDKLEELGFVSAPQGSKPREVLVDWKTYQEWRNNNAK